MRSPQLAVLLLVAALALPACDRGVPRAASKSGRAEAGVVVATVDGAPITRADLDRRVRRVTAGDEAAAADPALRASLLDQLVEERLLLAEAERRGLSIPPADVEARAKADEAALGREAFEKQLALERLTPEGYRAQVGERLLIKALLATVPEPKPITEHDVRSYYEEHRADFAQPAQFRARVITVASRAEAESIRAQLAAGADFAALAAQSSTSPEKERGGDLGFVPQGRLPPEFDAAIAALKPGELSPVVESPYGVHVFRLEERRPARQRTLDQARDEIRESLTMTRRENAYERWLADLRTRAKIEVLDPALRAAGAEPVPAASAAR